MAFLDKDILMLTKYSYSEKMALFIREHLNNADAYNATFYAPFIDKDGNGDSWLYGYTDAESFGGLDNIMKCLEWHQGEGRGVQRSGTKLAASLLGTPKRYEMDWADRQEDGEIIAAKLKGNDGQSFEISPIIDTQEFAALATIAGVPENWTVCYRVFLGSTEYNLGRDTMKLVQLTSTDLIND